MHPSDRGKGLPRDDVLMLLSAAMDLHVTQIVDGTKGIHAMMPKSIFGQRWLKNRRTSACLGKSLPPTRSGVDTGFPIRTCATQ